MVTSSVLGRITTPVFNETAASSFYDTWMAHGTWTGTFTLWNTIPCAMGLNNFVETDSGLCVTTYTVESLAAAGEGLFSAGLMLQFNKTASTLSIIGAMDPLEDVDITGYETTESMLSSMGCKLTYGETGYWYMNLGELNETLSTVRLNSLSGSYFNWTFDPYNSTYNFIPTVYGLSQKASIPTNLWNFIEDQGLSWNPTYYNETDHTGWRDIIQNGTETSRGITNLTRFYFGVNGDPWMAPVNLFCLAPAWIREGTVMLLLMPLPLLYPNNTMPGFGLDSENSDQVILSVLPLRVSGAVTVNIGGYDYDCWKADVILPSGLSSINLTQFSYTAYFERSTGVLMKAEADLEFTMTMNIEGTVYYVPTGYHKTWTISDIDGSGVPSPDTWSEIANIYSLGSVSSGVKRSLDSSFFNGGSVTIECNETVNSLKLMTYTVDSENYTSINGHPIVKLLITSIDISVPYELNATLNFHYTPSELSVRGAKASDLTIYYYNYTSDTWVPLNTTVDSSGRIVSANTTHLSVFALVAAPLTIWDILGPGGIALLIYFLNQLSSPPMGGLMLPIMGGIVVLIALIAVALVMHARGIM